ncbi:MAG: hypothetical protein ACI4S3_10675 [Candidatus Gastranaerophilaceae bacterium]
MKKFLSILLLLMVGCFVPCFAKKSANEVITPQTQLQKRQYQTRQYSNIQKATLMKAMLNILQDEGFIVNNANSLLGFISGAKEFSPNDKTIDMVAEFGTKKGTFGAVVAVVEATANVSEYGKDYKVRINFKRKLLNAYGNAYKIDEVTDEKYYQNFFSKVDKAIFIQKQKI